MTLDDHLLTLLGRGMPLGLTDEEIRSATPQAFSGDVLPALVRLSREGPPRVKLVDKRWKLSVAPAAKRLLSSKRDPGAALGFGGGPAIVLHSRRRS